MDRHRRSLFGGLLLFGALVESIVLQNAGHLNAAEGDFCKQLNSIVEAAWVDFRGWDRDKIPDPGGTGIVGIYKAPGDKPGPWDPRDFPVYAATVSVLRDDFSGIVKLVDGCLSGRNAVKESYSYMEADHCYWNVPIKSDIGTKGFVRIWISAGQIERSVELAAHRDRIPGTHRPGEPVPAPPPK